ncbi:tRNA (5-methylaminomethyl-2-thiouridine)(34)-methyltransferase MnmD [Leptospira ilyithenensis]|uniref:tRNA (5-methylaminomethyl-2-thiouridine)(34)-methyltransferase MnmD n=1 Tax=Leptospira ilyithenensis TaxID=2484901 RepID=UPI001FE32BD5|nr:tRNA (5-methylaminomethyl-2-thiouridine)(34)-methyltransferase MnmD [Leptospira ilyithenensis]
MTEVFFENEVPISERFGDVYFSKQGGTEESAYVFFEGNRIQKKWKETNSTDNSSFTIGELGFGTGLNYFISLENWKKETCPPNVSFYSLEKFPLESSTLKIMKNHFPEIPTWEIDLLDSYEKVLKNDKDTSGSNIWTWSVSHPSHKTRFDLHVYFSDVLATLGDWKETIDAWYLDGFSPAKNPEMWTAEVFQKIRNLSREGTSFATFTAAGFVRRNLESVGFQVKKQTGFGRKREMLVGGI